MEITRTIIAVCLGLVVASQEKICGSPGQVDNGEIEYHPGNEFGDKLVVTCNLGFRLVGKRELTCGDQGWLGRLPVCEVVTCDLPAGIPNGLFSPVKDVYNYREVVQYSCTGDLILSGSKSVTCSEDGTFTPGPPQCTGKVSPTTPTTTITTPTDGGSSTTVAVVGGTLVVDSQVTDLIRTWRTHEEPTGREAAGGGSPADACRDSAETPENSRFGHCATPSFLTSGRFSATRSLVLMAPYRTHVENVAGDVQDECVGDGSDPGVWDEAEKDSRNPDRLWRRPNYAPLTMMENGIRPLSSMAPATSRRQEDGRVLSLS
ncbi:Membrane cofactor protein [Takifugu flavidus]|uniref:Membrane cofactor protein n=1 Tax=Takifugu flavidus TaxID=433684 RepID=A0A5C6MPA8_9TELE|nr:Membrane cofactor protein [Takifugu flavidus]